MEPTVMLSYWFTFSEIWSTQNSVEVPLAIQLGGADRNYALGSCLYVIGIYCFLTKCHKY